MLEIYLVPKIAECCKKTRINLSFPIERKFDKAFVSRIEEETIPKSGNFIAEIVLLDYPC